VLPTTLLVRTPISKGDIKKTRVKASVKVNAILIVMKNTHGAANALTFKTVL
jgi:hypothetical protein